MEMRQIQQRANALTPAPAAYLPNSADLAWIAERIKAGEVSKPGPEIDDFTRKLLIALWFDTLKEIGRDRFHAAFMRVLKVSTFRPDIAEIRKAAGINHGIHDPREKEALSELKFLLAAMKLHGPELKPKEGRIVESQDAEGKTVRMLSPTTPAPALSDRTERALVEFGGTREGGLKLIACHPAISRDEDNRFHLKAVTELEKRWIQSYVGCR